MSIDNILMGVLPRLIKFDQQQAPRWQFVYFFYFFLMGGYLSVVLSGSLTGMCGQCGIVPSRSVSIYHVMMDVRRFALTSS